MKTAITLALVITFTLFAQFIAAENNVSFTHKDWEIVCDNTLTCRAAGYGKEEGTGGSVLLTRKAGPDTPLEGKVMLAEMETEIASTPIKLTLWIDGKPLGALSADDTLNWSGNWYLSDSQTSALTNAVKGNGNVEFKGGADTFVLSGDGAYAVMLKMDDVQGRIGTPSALTQKGNKPESSVLAAIPKPVIRAAKVNQDDPRPLTVTELEALKPRLLASLDQDECYWFQSPEESEIPDFFLVKLDEKHVAITALCWRAAYNEGTAYWVIDSELKGNPVLVTTSSTYYDKGELWEIHKERGLGDCYYRKSWVWDGQAFRKSFEATTGRCQYLRDGGTWDLPSFESEVIPSSQ